MDTQILSNETLNNFEKNANTSYIETLETEFYNIDLKAVRSEVIREIATAKRNGDQELLDFLKEELKGLNL